MRGKRGLVRATGVASTVLSSAYWIVVAPAHDATTATVMFVLIGVGLIGSVFAGVGSRWATPLMALGAIPGTAALLIPGLMLLIGAFTATVSTGHPQQE